MVSLARKNLLEDLPRFLVAQAGIVFAVSLITLQTGIFSGFIRSTVVPIDRSRADIWLASEMLVQLELTLPLSVSQLQLARQVPGVQRAEGLIFTGAQWYPDEGEMARVRLVAFDPRGELYRPPEIEPQALQALESPYTIVVDATDRDSLHVEQVGETVQINALPARVVGFTNGHAATVSNPFVVTSLKNAIAYATSGQNSRLSCRLPQGESTLECTNRFTIDRSQTSQSELPEAPRELASTDLVTFILVRAEPGVAIEQLKPRLEAALPGTRAYATEEIRKITQAYWQNRTGIGFILGLGAVVGGVVGVVVVSQILYSSVTDHLKEFGTLKAIGASAATIYGIIIEQALWMAALGYLPGMVLCLSLSLWISNTRGVLILITPTSALSVLGVTIIMCVGSAIFAIQKVNRVDPAIVFKA